MNSLRTISTRRLLALIAGVVALVAGGTTIALAGGSGPVPPGKPLADAVHDALTGSEPAGITARIEFTNHLIDSSAVQSGNPLLDGATGRLWLGSGHRLRLELQGSRGDTQLVVDGRTASLYDAASNAVYRADLPQGSDQGAADQQPADTHAPPALADIQRGIDRLMGHAGVSGAQPGDVGGRPAYTVRISPKQDGGLVGAAELAWDAERGVPLRVAVYARGSDAPVLELRATDIGYGPVDDSVFAISPPADAKVTDLTPQNRSATAARSRADARGAHARAKPVTGKRGVAASLPFALSAPDTLAGMALNEVRLLGSGDHPAALVTYGQGLGGIAVLERAAGKDAPAPVSKHDGERPGVTLPTVTIGDAKGQELETALGTIVQFSRAGVSYVVAGSVTRTVAEAAARGL